MVVNNILNSKQRYKCKQCGCNFIVGDAREKVSPEGKALTVLLYASGKAGYGFIARLFGVSRPTVLHWIRSIASRLPEPKIEGTIREIQIDEMCILLEKKRKIWIWRALDCVRKQTGGWFIGDRSAKTFEKFYSKIASPHAIYYTDNFEVYCKILPKKRHVRNIRLALNRTIPI